MTMNEPTATEPSHLCPPAYHPGHPSHYLPRGDNRPPLSAGEIAPATCAGFATRDVPKHEPAREHRIRKLLATEETDLAQSVARYDDIVARGADALSQYDRDIAYHKGRIVWLQSELDHFGPLLF